MREEPGSAVPSDGHDEPLTSCAVETCEGVATVRVTGDLDMSSHELLVGTLARAMEATPRLLVADLSGCGFVCRRSFTTLDATAERLRDRGADMVVVAAPTSFRLIQAALGRTARTGGPGAPVADEGT